MKARFTGLLLCFSILFSFFPTNVSAEEYSRSFTDVFNGEAYTVTEGFYYAYGNLGSSGSTYLPYFYSDGYFSGSSAVRDSHLATMSFNLAIAATHSGGVGNSYNHAVIRKLLAEIGCRERSIFVNDMSLKTPTADSIAFALAHKPLKLHNGDFILLPIAVRGGGYGEEWASNVTIGTEGEAKGFRFAADTVWADLSAYLAEWELTEAAENGQVKFWPVGYSRGGAVANLVAKDLADRYGAASVYGYTFEAPMGGLAASDKAEYDCIHNYVNYADLVPLVPPTGSGFGFARYGEDFVFPAKEGYDAAFSAMAAQLAAVDPRSDYIAENNAFRLHYLNIEISDYLKNLSNISEELLLKEIPSYNYTANDGNSLYFVGHFMRAFMTQLQSSKQTWGVYNRAQYSANRFTLNKTQYPYTIEEAAAGLIGSLMNADSSFFDDVGNQFEDYLKAFGISDYASLLALYGDLKDALKYWNSGKVSTGLFSSYDDSDRASLYNALWKHVKAAGVLNTLKEYQFDTDFFEKVTPPLFCLLMSFASLDYNTKANAYSDGLGFSGVSSNLVLLGTAISNYQLVETNHEYWPNLAWVRSYDSYYTMKGVPAASSRPSGSVTAPAAFAGESAVSSSSDAYTPLRCGDELLLDAPLCVGETIYYDIYDVSHDCALVSNRLYYASVSLPDNKGEGINYRITARSYCNGVHSGSMSYYVKSIPSCSFASVAPTQGGISYEFDSNYTSGEEKVIIMAAAYDQGKLAQAAFSSPITLTSLTNRGVLDIDFDERLEYRLFLVNESGYAPLCPDWCSTAAQ